MCRRRRLTKELLEQNPAVGFRAAHNHKFRPTGEDLSKALAIARPQIGRHLVPVGEGDREAGCGVFVSIYERSDVHVITSWSSQS